MSTAEERVKELEGQLAECELAKRAYERDINEDKDKRIRELLEANNHLNEEVRFARATTNVYRRAMVAQHLPDEMKELVRRLTLLEAAVSPAMSPTMLRACELLRKFQKDFGSAATLGAKEDAIVALWQALSE